MQRESRTKPAALPAAPAAAPTPAPSSPAPPPASSHSPSAGPEDEAAPTVTSRKSSALASGSGERGKKAAAARRARASSCAEAAWRSTPCSRRAKLA